MILKQDMLKQDMFRSIFNHRQFQMSYNILQPLYCSSFANEDDQRSIKTCLV